LWAESHRPETLSEIRGQDAAVGAMRRWALSWEKGKPISKAILLHGPAGTGKTTAALALGREMGWEVVEVNASDKRSQSALEEIIRSSRTRYSLLSGRNFKLFILDEVDGLSGTEDLGGARAIGDMIRKSVNPIILICNDYYSPRLRYLKRLAKGVEFPKPQISVVQGVLRDILRKEGLKADFIAVRTIAERADGDLRSAINDLEAVSMEGGVSREDLKTPGSRKSETDVYRVLDLIFNGDPEAVWRARELDLRPDQLLDWIAENVHLVFTDELERARAYERLSAADIYLSRVYRRMHWGFWGYATETMTIGLASVSGRRFPTLRRLRYSYPTGYFRYRTMMRSLGKGSGENTAKGGPSGGELGAARLLGERCHMSTRSVYRDLLPFLRVIRERKPEMAGSILRWAGLAEEELEELIS